MHWYETAAMDAGRILLIAIGGIVLFKALAIGYDIPVLKDIALAV